MMKMDYHSFLSKICNHQVRNVTTGGNGANAGQDSISEKMLPCYHQKREDLYICMYIYFNLTMSLYIYIYYLVVTFIYIYLSKPVQAEIRVCYHHPFFSGNKVVTGGNKVVTPSFIGGGVDS